MNSRRLLAAAFLLPLLWPTPAPADEDPPKLLAMQGPQGEPGVHGSQIVPKGPWTATSYSAIDGVWHEGAFYFASESTLSTDVPGTSAKWKLWMVPPAPINGGNYAIDLTDDLECVGAFTPGQSQADSLFTQENGAENSEKIHQALHGGLPPAWYTSRGLPVGVRMTNITDRYGKYFPIASDDPNRPYALVIGSSSITATGTIYGGSFTGRAFGSDRNFIPPVHNLGGTVFVNCTRPTTVPYPDQETIRFRGTNWQIGPFTIHGRYFPGTMSSADRKAALQNEEVAKFGFKFQDSPAGRTIGSLHAMNCVEGITYTRDASTLWHVLRFDACKYGIVLQNQQAVGITISKLRLGGNVEVAIDARTGGTVWVNQCDWLAPCLLLRIGGGGSGSNHYEIRGIQGDSQVFVQNGNQPTSLLGNNVKLLEIPSGAVNTCRVLIQGHGNNSGHAWLAGHRYTNVAAGRSSNIQIDMPGFGLGVDETVRFRPKGHFAESAERALTDQDQGFELLGSSGRYLPSDKLVTWLDFSNKTNRTSAPIGSVERLTSLTPRAGSAEIVLEPRSGTNGPEIASPGDGPQRREAARFSSNFLEAPSAGMKNVGKLFISVVMARNPSGTSDNGRYIASVYNSTENQLAWGLRITGSNDGGAQWRPRFFVSRGGDAADEILVWSGAALPSNMPALVQAYYDGVGGEIGVAVNGVWETAATSGTGPIFDSSAPLTIGGVAGSAAVPMSGDVGAVLIYDDIPDEAEQEMIARQMFRQWGVPLPPVEEE